VGSDTSPGSASAPVNPVFVDAGPSAPLKYRDVATISLAISYTESKEQLRALLLSAAADDARTASNTQRTNAGSIANAPSGKYSFLMAKIESCLLMICETQDAGVRSVADDPMVWHWAITPERNEGGNTVIIVGIYGSKEQNGPWLKVAAIPDIKEKARIESRSWFLDNWDKALGMLGGLLAFLITHWFRPGGKTED
jgi:hypothetical protein